MFYAFRAIQTCYNYAIMITTNFKSRECYCLIILSRQFSLPRNSICPQIFLDLLLRNPKIIIDTLTELIVFLSIALNFINVLTLVFNGVRNYLFRKQLLHVQFCH